MRRESAAAWAPSPGGCGSRAGGDWPAHTPDPPSGLTPGAGSVAPDRWSDAEAPAVDPPVDRGRMARKREFDGAGGRVRATSGRMVVARWLAAVCALAGCAGDD